MTDEPTVDAAAEDQLQRESRARRELARGCGLALIELTSRLEDDVVLDRQVDPLGFVLVGFAARGRRLLRSAYLLLDAGEGAAAVPLLRILSEYTIVVSWLVEHPDRLAAWAVDDHGWRDFAIGKIIDELDDENTRASLKEQRKHLAAKRAEWIAASGKPAGAVPPVEVMATETGLGIAYQLAYRIQTHTDVHATPLAVDTCFEQLPDGTVRLLPAPVHGLWNWDQYAIGAHVLRDLLARVAGHLPMLMWTTGLEGVTQALETSRASDPYRHQDPIQALRDGL